MSAEAATVTEPQAAPPALTAEVETPVPGTIEEAAAVWKALDLNGKKAKLDEGGAGIAEYRQKFADRRKRLVGSTTEFRKLTDDASKIRQIPSLMKIYQDEIDLLTKRCKSAESAFSLAYRTLVAIPDLSTALGSASVSSAADLENRRLREELAACRMEFSGIQNQQVTLRKLEAQVREAAEVAEAERRRREEAEAGQRGASEMVTAMSARVQEKETEASVLGERVLKATRALQESQSNLLSLKSSFDAQMAARQSEIDLLNSELRRMSEVAASGSPSGTALPPPGPPRDAEVALELKVAQAERECAKAKDRADSAVRECEGLKTQAASLRNEVEDWKVREENARADARVAREELDSERRSKEAEMISANPVEGEQELVDARGERDELRREVERLREESGVSSAEVVKLRQLVESLEDQLAKRTSQVTAAQTPVAAVLVPAVPAVSRPEGSSATAVLEIVCGQRDRFKAKIVELEKEKSQVMESLERAQSELQILKADNLKLYQRARFLQQPNNSGGAAAAAAPPSMTEVDDRYRGAYEETVSPFAVFRRKEREWRYRDLNAADKVVLRSTKLVLTNKWTRLGLVVYVVVLHLLVFITLYRFSSSAAH